MRRLQKISNSAFAVVSDNPNITPSQITDHLDSYLPQYLFTVANERVEGSCPNSLLNDICREFACASCRDEILFLSGNVCLESSEIVNRILQSNHERQCTLEINNKKSVFEIPPNSYILLGEIPFPKDCIQDHTDWKFRLDAKISKPIESFVKQKKADFVSIDPPWISHSVRRSRKYWMLDFWQISEMLSRLPLHDWITKEAVVGIWITNNPKAEEIARFVSKQWGLGYSGELFWCKVTEEGHPKYPSESKHRQSFERLLLFRFESEEELGKFCLYSVPSQHSRKPDLCYIREILATKTNKQFSLTIDLFARSASNSTLSVGNESIKFNAR